MMTSTVQLLEVATAATTYTLHLLQLRAATVDLAVWVKI
jgi:hypothetical protein